ncbi:hypothetical protein BDN71DRAFT_1436820 [Pleurotus eryngii]|uniref:Uncharacterized protein n=1 Tax=Pleurotus eryngii TaxID=5323 RepID=A0A9P5ZHW4_PLEER|nr:hypothetical protein BDN71DRAFT_1436820 [Pleurotus eryngii]
MILATYSAYISQRPYAYPLEPEQDWEGLITSIYTVYLSLSLYSRGRKGDEGDHFPRNWESCRNRQRLWITSLVKLLAPVDFEKIVDSTQMIDILSYIPPTPPELHGAALDVASQDLFRIPVDCTGVDIGAMGASYVDNDGEADEDGPYVSDDAYDCFGNQKPQNAYSQDMPDGWGHLAIGSYASEDFLLAGWKYL